MYRSELLIEDHASAIALGVSERLRRYGSIDRTRVCVILPKDHTATEIMTSNVVRYIYERFTRRSVGPWWVYANGRAATHS